MPDSAKTPVGTVVSLWRYPVKSMMGEELNAAEVTERGLLGDRAYALVDSSDGKVASAKNPKKWPGLFDFRAAFAAAPRAGADMPSVRITMPDGALITSGHAELDESLSRTLNREVTFTGAGQGQGSASETAPATPWTPQAEEYWPDMDGLDHRDTVTDFELPEGTFFDCAPLHLLTTATLDRLRELYPQGRFEARRFRPNVVALPLENAPGFVEGEWIDRTVAIGEEVRLRITGPCPRCVMTTLAQGDLPKDPGILRAAAQHNHANIGVYASVVAGGTIRRGDVITVSG
ncbi:MAG TPA: MOSC N-terminal beta barrel domain-containing protein [Candidatus Dormibacteraeota bacterium]